MEALTPHPQYRIPLPFLLKFIPSFILKKQRSFRADAKMVIAGVIPQPTISGFENLPNRGPLLILHNHYSRSGSFIIWAAFAISSSLSMESCWMMTRAWTAPGTWYGGIQKFLTSAVYRRIAKMYGFISMPPMPPDPRDTLERAIGVRTLMQIARRKENIAICLAPEGRDFPGGRLGWPPPGSGRLIHQLGSRITRRIQRLIRGE